MAFWQRTVKRTEEHHHIHQIHPVQWQRLQEIEEGKSAHRDPVQVLMVQVTEAPLLCDIDSHHQTCREIYEVVDPPEVT